MRHIVNIGTLFAPRAGFTTRLPAWRLPGWLDRKPRHGVKNMPNHRGSFNPEPTATVIRLATGERLRLRLRIKRWVSYRLGLLCDLLRRRLAHQVTRRSRRQCATCLLFLGDSSLLTALDGWRSDGPLPARERVMMVFAEDVSMHLAGIPV